MAGITASAVKELREKTGLPMMDCKKALAESGGDQEEAINWLRQHGKGKMEGRTDRATGFGRVAVYYDADKNVGAIVEIQCESAPVAGHEDFVGLAEDLVKQLATGPGAETPADLLAQPSPSKPGQSIQDRMDEIVNRIREVFKVPRIARFEGKCATYTHHTGSPGVLLAIEGDDIDAARDVCMHIAAMRPQVLSPDRLDAAEVEKERQFLSEQARQEGKPENILEKMVEGRLRNYYAERCLTEQPFVKDDKQTVGKFAKGAGLKLTDFIRWDIGEV